MTSAENNRMLLKELQEGNQKVFDKLFDQYYHPMCTFIYPLIEEKHIVEDIVSDCFVKLWEQRKDIHIHTSVTNYLLTLVKNAAISFLRKKKQPQIDFEQVSNTLAEDDAEIIRESDIYNKLYLAVLCLSLTLNFVGVAEKGKCDFLVGAFSKDIRKTVSVVVNESLGFKSV